MNKKITPALQGKKFQNFISLGGNCSVAMELNRVKLRDASYPFDWVISEWSSVLKLCAENFDGLLDEDKLYQSKSNLKVFLNRDLGIYFYHDFNEFEPLKQQLKKVKIKYQRRIKRFYKAIRSPTLFIRYIRNQEEAQIIETDYLKYVQFFKSFNPDNEICFIQNNHLTNMIQNSFWVEPDEGDVIARQFLDKNVELKALMESYPKKKQGIKVLWAKCKRKILFKQQTKFKAKKQKYIHDKQYE